MYAATNIATTDAKGNRLQLLATGVAQQLQLQLLSCWGCGCVTVCAYGRECTTLVFVINALGRRKATAVFTAIQNIQHFQTT